MSKYTYKVQRFLEHDLEPYNPGDLVELTEDQARPLLDLTVIQGPVGEATPVKPGGEALTKAIQAVFPELDTGKDYTKAGNPKVDAVSGLLGYEVSAKEIDQAWDAYEQPEDAG